MVAIDAIDRAAGARLKGNLGFLSAFAAFYGEELPRSGRSIGHHFFLNGSLGSFGGTGHPASRTALGRMVMPLCAKSLLLFHTEYIGRFTIKADK